MFFQIRILILKSVNTKGGNYVRSEYTMCVLNALGVFVGTFIAKYFIDRRK